MTRILHLSDLHFGFERGELAEPLLAQVNRQQADLVVVTGDVTHRARPDEFRRAAAFLGRIDTALMVVPGNHDIPLYNIGARFFRPWSDYRRAVGCDLSPVWNKGGIQVLGLNSVDPFSWRRGRLRGNEVARVIRQIDPQAVNIVALHHPLQQLPQSPKEPALHASSALARLEEAGAYLVLSGHLHIWDAGTLLRLGPHERVLQVQAGSALCARPEDPPNEFAVLDIDGPDLLIERHVGDDTGFRPTGEPLRFSRSSGVWRG
ncbi:metallophosphoesterase family protein [Paracoccus alkanivorans]|uniref:Metallophosphoesterase n=1 Tax=Paracoccus alkanivorans TaxID=2116655 RepID=A0A3M0M9L6_9RHOB|nr:metallophosphoesterase [Paracoccus alkanivorans]RMC34221.1 metallophosphoesterase [Paracoccus alkanivorans]